MRKNIEFDELSNFRDLAGIRTPGGRTVKPGLLYRGGHLAWITDRDKARLTEEFGIVKVIDLRTADELSRRPDQRIDGVEYLHLPLVEQPSLRPETSTREDEQRLADIFSVSMDKLTAVPDMAGLYRLVLTTEYGLSTMRRVIREIMECEGGCLFHCTAGKDRTGITAMVLGLILGLDREAVMEDYLATNAHASFEGDRQYAVFLERTGDPDIAAQVRRVCMADESFLGAVYGAVDSVYGGPEEFVSGALGISEKVREEFKSKVLTD